VLSLFALSDMESVPPRCPPGFERGPTSCYAFAQGPSTHGSAIEICESLGSMLACPTTQEELTYLNTRAQNDNHDYWIGINDILHEGQWQWPGLCRRHMQVNLTYPWCPGEPNNAGGDHGGDCVRIVGAAPSDGSHSHPQQCWADYQCDMSTGDHGATNDFGFICELNVAKFGDEDAWERLYDYVDGDDDDDGEEEEEEADEEERRERGEQGNPTAVTFAVLFALAFAASAAYNVVLLRRRAATPVMNTMNTVNSNYQAPLRQAPSSASQPV